LLIPLIPEEKAAWRKTSAGHFLLSAGAGLKALCVRTNGPGLHTSFPQQPLQGKPAGEFIAVAYSAMGDGIAHAQEWFRSEERQVTVMSIMRASAVSLQG
jgi:hypothetical protein